MTGLDSSSTLLGDLKRTLSAERPDVRECVHLVHGDARRLLDLFAPASFDVVLCHGVLMYFADPDPLLNAMAAVIVPGGLISLLVRNGDALAMRPGLLGNCAEATEAFESASYQNRLEVHARADRLDALTASLTERYLSIVAWYGVRVFTDSSTDDTRPPEPEQLHHLLACEERAGRTDPYRRVAALLHVIAMST